MDCFAFQGLGSAEALGAPRGACEIGDGATAQVVDQAGRRLRRARLERAVVTTAAEVPGCGCFVELVWGRLKPLLRTLTVRLIEEQRTADEI